MGKPASSTRSGESYVASICRKSGQAFGSFVWLKNVTTQEGVQKIQ